MAVNTQIQTGLKWVWKDDTNTLEPVSGQNAHGAGRGQGRRQKGGHYQDHSKRSDRGAATPSLKSYGVSRGRQSRALAGQRSPRQGTKQNNDKNHVTLEDVKALALELLAEVEDISLGFEHLQTTEQFDDFLLYLLNYFNTFNEKRSHEQKPNPMNISESGMIRPDTETPLTISTPQTPKTVNTPLTVNTPKSVNEQSRKSSVNFTKQKVKREPSLAERKYYADLCAKMELAQKQLGQSYGVLVLGVGLDEQHHMACGQSRVSSTHKDRTMYETLYAFCAFVVWITFRRKDYDSIKKEVGRILRSDTFNPAIRVKNAPDAEPVGEESQGKKEKCVEVKLTPAEYRRLHGKRPAIKSIINQRSPALVSILPQPSEASAYLFKRTRPLSPTSLVSHSSSNEADLEHVLQGMHVLNVSRFQMGIIGEPLSGFNPRTLTPLGADNEDEENTEEGKEGGGGGTGGAGGGAGRRESQLGLASRDKALTDGQAVGRQVSMVTTEAPSDDD